MYRVFAIVALLLTFGHGGCDLLDPLGCLDATESERNVLESRASGSFSVENSKSFYRVDCSTCGHSTFRVTWELERPADRGEVTVQLLFTCEAVRVDDEVGLGEEIMKPYYSNPTSSVRVFLLGRSGADELRGSTTFSDVNVKNHCGEDKHVLYKVVVRQDLEDYDASLPGIAYPGITIDVHSTCPKFEEP